MARLSCLIDIPASEYHDSARKGQYLSSHLLGDFIKAPKLYRKKMTGELEPNDSAALQTGRAVHSLILEGRSAFDQEFIVASGPINERTKEPYTKTSKAYKEWAATQERTVVSPEDFAFFTQLQRSVWLHPVATELLDAGMAEKTVRTQYCGEMCQIRMDWFREDYNGRPIICDLKTCESIDNFLFDAKRFGYGNQAAFYKAVLETASDGELKPDCYLIAIEKREPFRCACYKLTDELLDLCRRENEKAIAELHECRITNTWPTRTEDLRVMDI